jgi:hypothetical protein
MHACTSMHAHACTHATRDIHTRRPAGPGLAQAGSKGGAQAAREDRCSPHKCSSEAGSPSTARVHAHPRSGLAIICTSSMTATSTSRFMSTISMYVYMHCRESSPASCSSSAAVAAESSFDTESRRQRTARVEGGGVDADGSGRAHTMHTHRWWRSGGGHSAQAPAPAR